MSVGGPFVINYAYIEIRENENDTMFTIEACSAASERASERAEWTSALASVPGTSKALESNFEDEEQPAVMG